ncbi:MmcQ/YjbR family DNA-binding protein [Nocardioides sambongensis]|uniref:MmcQ/YjbR family DNA-binding protein n=1 Tax=Nocardioides sambongensis TaxID=2589074 RepID=UPI0011263AE1|nr:MmcQ/YjbR family DNA-binding protein [Nocardioides sambongensis]
MPTLEDVRRIAAALPAVTERPAWGQPMWRVKDRGFVWERPLGKKDVADLESLGQDVPDGELIGLRVADEADKQALIASDPDVFLTIPHLDGYSAVLVRLDRVDPIELDELIVEAWLLRAPKRLAADFLAARAD